MIQTKELPANIKTIKVEAKIWNTLKNLKKYFLVREYTTPLYFSV